MQVHACVHTLSAFNTPENLAITTYNILCVCDSVCVCPLQGDVGIAHGNVALALCRSAGKTVFICYHS